MTDIEETVARLESYWPDDTDTRALIASWRERGEALKAANKACAEWKRRAFGMEGGLPNGAPQ